MHVCNTDNKTNQYFYENIKDKHIPIVKYYTPLKCACCEDAGPMILLLFSCVPCVCVHGSDCINKCSGLE